MQPKTSSSAGWLLVILANLLIHLATALPPRATGLRAYRDESDDGGPVRDESVRHLDPIGGGHLLRDTWAVFGRNTRPTRGLDSLSGVTFGGARKRYDSLGGITFGNSKRNFDEIDRAGFNGFVKKNFDEIDRSGFDTFVKRNFDEIDRAGFGSFVKRSAPLFTQNPNN